MATLTAETVVTADSALPSGFSDNVVPPTRTINVTDETVTSPKTMHVGSESRDPRKRFPDSELTRVFDRWEQYQVLKYYLIEWKWHRVSILLEIVMSL